MPENPDPTMKEQDFDEEPQGENNDVVVDEFKAHISRIPTKFTQETVERILKEHLKKQQQQQQPQNGGNGDDNDEKDDNNDDYSFSIELIYPRDEDDEEEGGADGGKKHNDYDDEENKYTENNNNDNNDNKEHRGFGFVTFTSEAVLNQAIELETIRGGRKPTSKKQHTMYIRPYADKTTQEEQRNVCYLWKKHRCPYGEECKFTHSGPGGCKEKDESEANMKKKKKGKCFAYKKGKCDKGDDCPFSHDFKVEVVVVVPATSESSSKEQKESTTTTTTTITKKADSEKDCINWKTKGKCRKGDKCPYKHDPKKAEAALKKKNKRKKENEPQTQKQKQPLSVRVFGLNYETTEQDIRNFFQDCGTIKEVTFPIFEDSGRSKGYCGVWFCSPKAVAKAIELDGQELMGRWLQIQAGKMYLKQWEANHPGGGGGGGGGNDANKRQKISY